MVGVVGTPDHRAAGDVAESKVPANLTEPLELFWGKVFNDGQVTGGGLKILAQRQEIAIRRTKVLHCLNPLRIGFTEP